MAYPTLSRGTKSSPRYNGGARFRSNRNNAGSNLFRGGNRNRTNSFKKTYHSYKPTSGRAKNRTQQMNTQKRRINTSSGNSYIRKQKRSISKAIIVFHGTPSAANARDILRNGWCVSAAHGNTYGDGIYFSQDVSVAKSFAGNSGVYLKCRLRLGRLCNWDANAQTRCINWCNKMNVAYNTNALTAWALKLGYDGLQAGNIIVVLYPLFAHPQAYK